MVDIIKSPGMRYVNYYKCNIYYFFFCKNVVTLSRHFISIFLKQAFINPQICVKIYQLFLNSIVDVTHAWSDETKYVSFFRLNNMIKHKINRDR